MDKVLLHLVYVTDKGYLMPTSVSMLSAYAWCDEPTQLVTHIVDIGISDEEWNGWKALVEQRLPSGVQVIRHKLPEDALSGLPEYRGNAATCARAYIPELLADVDWCLYVDGDTMFFDDPVKVGNFVDPSVALLGHRDRLDSYEDIASKSRWFGMRGMRWDVEQYICAGVLIMNLKWFRANDAGRKLLSFMRQYPESGWPDQDALYAVCYGHIKFLPDEWGMMDDHLWTSKGALPSCLHYVWEKPWNMTRVRILGRVPTSYEWLKSARLLTGLLVQELAPKAKLCTPRFCNVLGWFWHILFVVASISSSWRATHLNRLMIYPPRAVMEHISCSRLKKHLKQKKSKILSGKGNRV